MYVGRGHAPADHDEHSRMYQYSDENRFHSRKHPRLKAYDYSQRNFYFITICTNQKKCIFGQPHALNVFGKIAEASLLKMEEHFSGIRIDKYVIMPNHVHVIFEVTENGCDLLNAIGAYKSGVSKEIHKIEPDILVWQTSFHDHVIRNQAGYEKIWNYIETNPMKWEEDCFYQG
jgi:REP element-mobilizing transposase RayT